MHIDRRRFIAGAGGVMLAGCGGSGGGELQPGPPLGVVPGPAPPPTPIPSPTPPPLQAIRLDDPRLTRSGFAAVERSATRIRATRAADHQGLGFVTPGGRLVFSSDATVVRVDLAFHRTMGGAPVLNVGRGGDPTDAVLLVDGAPFCSVRSGSLPGDPARADLSIIGLPPGVKRVDVIWSHVRKMDVVGLTLDTGSLSPVVRPARRLVCGGDSITQGHSLSDPVYT